MTLTMRDSVNVADLTPGADAYAGYADGKFANLAQVRARFPRTRILSIAVFTQTDADACDVEAGDLQPWQAGPWVKRQLNRGVWRPVVYASVSVMPVVLADLLVAGVHRPQVRLWSAHYGEGKHICGPATCQFPGVPACDGTQWTNTAPGAGGSKIDESILVDGFFGPPAAGPFRHVLAAGQTLAAAAAARGTTALHLRDVTRGALTEADISQGGIYYTSRP